MIDRFEVETLEQYGRQAHRDVEALAALCLETQPSTYSREYVISHRQKLQHRAFGPINRNLRHKHPRVAESTAESQNTEIYRKVS